MKIINFAVKRPVAMTIIVSVVLILGFFTLSKIAVDLLPDMKLPYAAVITNYAGAGPEEVESQVTKRLEGTLNTIANIEEMQSMSSSGSSIILIGFKWGTNMDNALMDIREKTGIMEKYLPDGAEKPLVAKMDLTMMPVMQMGISASEKYSLAQLQAVAEDVIEPRLSRIPQVASIMITGGMQREIKVEIDPVKLENYGLTLAQINQFLQMENFNMSSGKVKEGGRQYYVRGMQEFETVDDIKNVAITTAAGNTVYLGDIAVITDGYKDDTQITRLGGKPALGIHCLKQSDANTVETCEAIRAEMEKIKQELNMDLDIEYAMDQSTFIKKSLDSTRRMMLEGALLAVVVLYIFLRNMRSTLIIFTAIPISIICTFILMYFNNNTLNLITMGGLALGIGRMVDDSIVVFENIYRHRCDGESPIQAALKGGSEVGQAVIASTLTIMAVFIPIMFAEGLASVLFKPLAITISFAIFCSLMVSLTIVPLLSSRMLTDASMARKPRLGRISKITDRFAVWLDSLGERYKTMLQWALSHRRRVVITVTVLMLVSIGLMTLVGAEFMPGMDSGEINISIETDKGSLLKDTDALVKQVENRLREIPEVDIVFSSIGSGGNMFLNSETQSDQAAISIKLVELSERDRSANDVAEDMRKRLADIPGAKISVTVSESMFGDSEGGPVNVQVRGDDLTVLRELSQQVEQIVRNVPGTREVTSSLKDGNPEVQVKIDRRRAATFGLTPTQVASEMRNAMLGTVSTTFKVEDDEVDVRLRYIPQSHDDMAYLQNLTVTNSQGIAVKLSQLADFTIAPGPTQIDRIDRVRNGQINAYLLNRDLNSVMKDIQAQVDKINLPNGYEVVYGGQNEDMMESFTSLAQALLLAIILVYAVMAVQYESFFNPFVIMFSVPTALIGVVAGLLLTGKHFSVSAFIGVIMLVGIVVANAIVLVDYLKQLRERGMERNAAILEAGRLRLRPILMTALATILAMLPLAIGIGEGSETEAPLAIVIIGGLLVSTFITLLLVPVVYSIFDDWGQKIKNKRQAKTGPEVSEMA